MISKKYAEDLLDKLINLDMQTVGAYYEMGRLLHAIYESKLHETLGYSQFSDLVERELSFSLGSAYKYRNLYKHFHRLHYTKAEALMLLQIHGMTNVYPVISGLSSKVGTRAIKRRIEAFDEHQLNFQLSITEFKKARRALVKSGATLVTEKLSHSSRAFMHMVNETLKH